MRLIDPERLKLVEVGENLRMHLKCSGVLISFFTMDAIGVGKYEATHTNNLG